MSRLKKGISMQRTISDKERQQLLMTRARRLLYFVETFNGRPNRTIELEAYLILQTYESRSRAIWRYIRFALREWRNIWIFIIKRDSLIFWYSRVKGLERTAAIEQAHQFIEERIFGQEEGGRQ